jgi:hypothetical protein
MQYNNYTYHNFLNTLDILVFTTDFCAESRASTTVIMRTAMSLI